MFDFLSPAPSPPSPAFRSFFAPATFRRMSGIVMPISFRSLVYSSALLSSSAPEDVSVEEARAMTTRATAFAVPRRTHPNVVVFVVVVIVTLFLRGLTFALT